MVVKGTIRAQRLLTGVEQHRPELLEEVSRQLWLRLWTRVRLPPQHSPAFLNDFIFSCFFLNYYHSFWCRLISTAVLDLWPVRFSFFAVIV